MIDGAHRNQRNLRSDEIIFVDLLLFVIIRSFISVVFLLGRPIVFLAARVILYLHVCIVCYDRYGNGNAEVDFDSPVEAKLAWLQVRSWLLILVAWGLSTMGLTVLVRCKVFPSIVYALWILAGNGAAPAWINWLTETELHVDQAAHEAMYV